jgi:hypothetical protein
MILDFLVGILLFVLNAFLLLLNSILSPFEFFLVTAPSYAGYVFGNIYLFNEFLPVQEFFELAVLAITLRLMLFSIKAVFLMMHVLNNVRKTFLSIRF